MAKCCVNHKMYFRGKNEYCLFTWSIPNISSINDLQVETSSFQIQDTTYSSILKISTEQIAFTIESRSNNLKCFVSMFMGDETLFSNGLNAPTSSSVYSRVNYYNYVLITLATTDECVQKMKQHPDDGLVLICRIKYSDIRYSTSSVDTIGDTVTDCLHHLKTLKTFLKNSSESLLKEKVFFQVGEETETVSKALLCTRSPVFAKMFEENDMKELNEGKITISDIKMPVLKVLVTYLYTGKLSQDKSANFDLDFICELYYASDKYNIADLRHHCVDLLLPHVSMENITRILAFAFSHNEERLKSTAMALIASNIETWMFTNDWKNLVNDEPKIAYEILNFFDF